MIKIKNSACFLLFNLDDRHSSNVTTLAEVETLPSYTNCESDNQKDDTGKM